VTWAYVRFALVATGFVGGLLRQGRDLNTGYTIALMILATFTFGVVAMLFVIGIQAFNARSAPTWSYPTWKQNPFTMREPLQLFHLCGYYFLAAGLGGLLHVAYDATLSPVEPAVFAATGMGVLCGVWLCCRVFRHKMART
jgi:hypothetical protein